MGDQHTQTQAAKEMLRLDEGLLHGCSNACIIDMEFVKEIKEIRRILYEYSAKATLTLATKEGPRTITNNYSMPP